MAEEADDAVVVEDPQLDEQQADDGPLQISIAGDEDGSPLSSEERDTGLVRHLRQTIREQAKALATKVTTPQTPEPQAFDPGPEPKIEDCAYDPDAFAAKYKAWVADQAKLERVKAEQEAAGRSVAEKYQTSRAKLKVPDYQDAEDLVASSLNIDQQRVVLKYADNPALVVAALGQNPARLAAFAKIADPIEMALQVRDFERKIEVTPTRKAAAPENIVRGNAGVQRVDKHLERLEAESAKTGDRTAVIAYKRKMRTA